MSLAAARVLAAESSTGCLGASAAAASVVLTTHP